MIEVNQFPIFVQQKAGIGGKAGDKAARNAAAALRLLRIVFLQDLPFYHHDFPKLPIFDSRLSQDHKEAFLHWGKLVQRYTKECEELMTQEQALEVFQSGTGDGGSMTVMKGMPIIAAHVQPPPGFRKVPIVGSEVLCYLEKVLARCNALVLVLLLIVTQPII